MNETPSQEQEHPSPDASRLNTENLRNYSALRRTTYDRKIAGVAGGLARHLNIDPIIVRVLFVVLIFFGGAGFILYAAAWLLVPDDAGKPAAVKTSDSTRNTLLIIAAAFAGLLLVGDSWGGFGFPWPLAILALIAFAILMSRDNAPVTPPAGPPVAPPPSAPASYAGHQPGTAYEAGDQATQTIPLGQPYHYAGPEQGWQPVIPQTPPTDKKKRGPILFGITIALVAAGFGVLGLWDTLADNNVAGAAYPALALAIIGGMLVVGAFYGRPGGLVLLGLIAAMVLAGSSIADPTYDGERDQVYRPASSAEVRDSYHVPAGRILLDLSRISEPGGLADKTIEVDANAGEIVVILPNNLAADVHADIDFGGAITLPDREIDGWGETRDAFVGNPDDPTVDLDLAVKFGHIEVRQAA